MTGKHIDNWFSEAPIKHRKTLAALRALVKSMGSNVAEELKWGRPCYSTARGMFCYIHFAKDHATLGFQKGTLLDDPRGCLEGTGKQMRHIKFKDGASPDAQVVRHLLRQAIAL